MPTTPHWSLPYPAASESPNGPAQIGALATALDSVAMDSQGTFANRPVSTPGSPGIAGRYYWATDQSILYRDHGTGWEIIGPTVTPPGSILQYAGAAAPSGWLLADGAVVSRTTYAALFAVVSTQFNIGGEPGSDFRLPNLKGRVPVGIDAAQGEFDQRGDTGGAKTHALGLGEMPSHSHTVNSHSHDMTHDHTLQMGNYPSPANTNFPGGADGSVHDAGGGGAGSPIKFLNGNTGAEAPGTNSQGSGSAHQNLQPYIALHYIIKT